MAMKNRYLLLTNLLIFTTTLLYGQQAYVEGYGYMTVVDPTNHSTQDSICCANFISPAPSNDNSTIYTVKVDFANGNKIYYIDHGTKQVTDSIDLVAHGVETGFNTNLLFARNVANNNIYLIDPSTKSIDSLSFNNPSNLNRRPNSEEVWVSNGASFGVVDYSSGTTITTYTYHTGSTFFHAGISFSHDGTQAIMRDFMRERIYFINANTKSIIDSMDVNGEYLEFNSDASEYIAVHGTKMYRYNVSTKSVIDSTELPHTGFDIFRNPVAEEIWVVYHNDDSIGIFNINTLASIKTIGTGSNPHKVAFIDVQNSTFIEANKKAISVYPNPASEYISFQGIALTKVYIYDNMGRLIIQQSNNLNKMISVKQLTKGIYTIRAYDERGQVYLNRLIKSES